MHQDMVFQPADHHFIDGFAESRFTEKCV
jgi:hypothetical protein